MEKIKHYSEEEINYLKKYYPKTSKEDILNNIKRSWISIQKKAHFLGLERINYESKNNNKYNKLLLDVPETYYWIGLLMSDGHFNKNGYITLSIDDIEHTNKLRKYLGIKESSKKLLSISDKITFEKLSEKFKITNHKTYEPCYLSDVKDEDLFFSLLIGFIDGDGSITKKSISVVSHKNWYNNFILFNNILSKGKNKISLDNDLIRINIGKNSSLKEIKLRAIKLNLPYLERKWDKIKLNMITKNEKQSYCIDLFKNGLNIKQIIELGIVGKSCVYATYKKYLNKY